MVRYCLKVAICLVIGYVIGLTSQRPDLSTILTTVIITALPTYGAAARKMILRVVGAILGGLVVIAMVIITSPNFETLPVYVIAIFVVLVVSGYAGQSSGRVAYAGTQLGTTMMLAFAGLSPSLAVEAPLWRIWSILLGTGVVLMVFTILWPEYASVALQPRLRQLMRLTLGLAPGVAGDVATIRRLDAELSGALEQTLAIADDARLEGGASRLDADAVVETAGTLRRIAHRFAGIALGRILHPRPRLDPGTEEAAHLALKALVSQLQVWLTWIDRPLILANPPSWAQETRAAMTRALGELTSRIEADRFARIADWGLEQRRTLLAELASLQRLSVLLGELDEYLARVLRARSARPR
jgi:Fusaric acid resistance protein family